MTSRLIPAYSSRFWSRLQAVINQLQVVRENELELEKQQENVEDDSDDNKNENVVGNEVTNTSSKARMLNATNSISNTATTNSVR